MSPYESVTSALRASGSQQRGKVWQCPAHDDRRQSLSVSAAKDDIALVHCHAGCAASDVVGALGLRMSDLFPDTASPGSSTIDATYDYVDETGALLFQVVRSYPKGFRQRRRVESSWRWDMKDVRRVPYRLPQLLDAVRDGRTVYVVEGERDVHAIERAGGVATCNPGGAGKWRDEYARYLVAADVVVIADRDEPGYRHAQQVADSLAKFGVNAPIVHTPDASHNDVADLIGSGGTLCDLVPVPKGTTRPGSERGMTLVRGSSVRTEPVEWLGEGLPLGNVTLVAGPPGLAKTTLLCEWAARISRGELPGAFHGRPMDVVLMSGEDSIHNTLVPRCEAGGGDLDRIWFVELGDDGFALPDDLDRLARLLPDVEAVMVGVDPLMAFVADRVDSHKDHHVRRVFSALRRFAETGRLAITVVAHLNKSESRDFLARVNGSVGIGAAVRSAWAVVEHPDDAEHRALVHTKNNLGPYAASQRFRIEPRTTLAHDGRTIDTSGIVWLGEDASITRSNVLDVPEQRTERDEAGGWLRSYLAEGPKPSEELKRAAKAAGFPDITLRRAKKDIGVRAFQSEGATGRVGGTAWCWALPGTALRESDAHPEGAPGEHLITSWSGPTSGIAIGSDAHPGPHLGEEHLIQPQIPVASNLSDRSDPITERDRAGRQGRSEPDERQPIDLDEAVQWVMDAFPGTANVTDTSAIIADELARGRCHEQIAVLLATGGWLPPDGFGGWTGHAVRTVAGDGPAVPRRRFRVARRRRRALRRSGCPW